jgi:hypothetical protein
MKGLGSSKGCLADSAKIIAGSTAGGNVGEGLWCGLFTREYARQSRGPLTA